MTHQRWFHVLVFSLVVISVPGCSRDPNAMKQKYLESGSRYFEEGKYPEAVIEMLECHKDRPAVYTSSPPARQNIHPPAGLAGSLPRTAENCGTRAR